MFLKLQHNRFADDIDFMECSKGEQREQELMEWKSAKSIRQSLGD